MSNPSRPAALVAASVLSAAASVFMMAMGVLAVATHPTPLSAGIAAVLVLWGVLVGAASVALWRGRRWSRGLVVAAGLLHLASAANFVGSQPLAAIPAALALATVVAVLRPSVTRALALDADPDAER